MADDPAIAETQVSDTLAHGATELAPFGYELGAVLGRGGMGEVVLAHDQRIGREVAYKRIRKADASAEALSRFLREARIQARLDHPAIVPVYELGKDSEGRPYFTMKRLVGHTLAEKLKDRSAPLQPLLRAFADVCLAIELAHSKGVVHRDLKPSNIMLGDFGEVYVIDWGVARVLAPSARAPTGADPIGDLESIGEGTAGGSLLGTVGYMPPEQLQGDEVGPRADVYALGSILFEILSGTQLHPRGHAALASTLSMDHASPAERAPDRNVPPELDALCTEMLAPAPEQRPTARAVAERVQQFLDGDRDLEARRSLAAAHLQAAHEALASNDPQRRVDALRSAGRALVLDPRSTDAADLVTSIIVEPPRDLPAELRDKLAEHEAALTRGRARRAVTGYLTLLVLTFLLPLFEIRNAGWLAAIYASIGGFALLSWRTSRTGRASVVGIVIGTLFVTIAFARIASPLVLVPTIVCATLVSIANIAWVNERPWVLYTSAAGFATLPLVAEWLGLLSPTTTVTHDTIAIRSAIFAPSGWVALPALAFANVVFLLIMARFIILISRDSRAAQQRLTIQAWHLGQLLPETAQVVASPRATRS